MRKRTLDPSWVETLSFAVAGTTKLAITVFDFDFARSNDVCGTVEVGDMEEACRREDGG